MTRTASFVAPMINGGDAPLEPLAVTTSLIEAVANGGCYWKRDRHDSPGHAFVTPDGTRFKVAVEGLKVIRGLAGYVATAFSSCKRVNRQARLFTQLRRQLTMCANRRATRSYTLVFTYEIDGY